MALTAAQQAVVKSTAPILKQHGRTITELFYKNMIGAHPELRNVFNLSNQHNGAQPRALANAVLAYAQHIDNLAALGPAVERIAHKHVSLVITPEQYDIVGEHLIKAIAEVLGDGLTPEVAEAWTAAYAQLAEVFIKREAEMYGEAGEWQGWRKFKIQKREKETEKVSSFYLVPADGDVPLPAFKPGQYVSVRVKIPGKEYFQARQYSMSQGPRGGHYRVTIKREPAPQDVGAAASPGLVSNLIHDHFGEGDEIELTFPRGEFFIDTQDASKADAPLVLLSAGVGVTPLMSILESVMAPESKMSGRPVRWIHAARSSKESTFAQRIRAIAEERENTESVFFVDHVVDGDARGKEFDWEGKLDLDKVKEDGHLGLGDKSTDYYVCGPAPWMLDVKAKLVERGVEEERVRMELFATGTVEEQVEP